MQVRQITRTIAYRLCLAVALACMGSLSRVQAQLNCKDACHGYCDVKCQKYGGCTAWDGAPNPVGGCDCLWDCAS